MIKASKGRSKKTSYCEYDSMGDIAKYSDYNLLLPTQMTSNIEQMILVEQMIFSLYAIELTLGHLHQPNFVLALTLETSPKPKH